MSDLSQWSWATSPPQPTPRWPGLLASVGGEAGVKSFMSSNPSAGSPGAWERGLKFVPSDFPDPDATPLDPCNLDPFTAGTASDEVQAAALIHWDAFECGTFSREDVTSRARAMLLGSTSHKLARELWTGDGATAYGHPTPFLMDSNADVITATATPLITAFSYAIEYAGNELTNTRLFAHVTPMTATMLQSAGIIRREGGILLDAFDNVVIADAGNPGTGPAGQTASTAGVIAPTAWMAITSQPFVRLSEVLTQEQTDTMNNVDFAVAYRLGLTTFDSPSFVIHLDLCNTCCTT